MDTKFDKWNTIKKQIDTSHTAKGCETKKVYWVSIGQNIGSEVYGKSLLFTRPVLVIKKFYNDTFLGIPLTSKTRNKSGFLFYKFSDSKGTIQVALLGQMRVFDTKRIGSYISKISNDDFNQIKQLIKENIIG